jgi:DNA-binding LacI/PurR family transcriptional regulator
VRQHLEQAGYMAMLYLLKLLGDTSIPESMDAVPELPPFEVIERQTTRPLAH